MSSKSEKKEYEDVLDYGLLNNDPINLKLALLSYENLGKKEKFIYDGYEKMPFHERHPTYQSIFRNEFTNIILKRSRRSFSTHLIF